MPLLRLAYVTQFLIALIAVFVLWSEVAGQVHLDLLPWYLKLGLGAGVAFATVKATAAAVEGKRAWNIAALRWLAVVLLLLAGCGVAAYYAHMYGEDDSPDENDDSDSAVIGRIIAPPVQFLSAAGARPARFSAPMLAHIHNT